MVARGVGLTEMPRMHHGGRVDAGAVRARGRENVGWGKNAQLVGTARDSGGASEAAVSGGIAVRR